MVPVWKVLDFEVHGGSIAGVHTSLLFSQLDLAFDVGFGMHYTHKASTFLVTQGHQDHAGGIPYILSQKSLNHHPTPTVFMPEELISPISQIVGGWEGIEDHKYNYKFVAAHPGEEVSLGRQFFIRPFRTYHRIPSVGYSLFRRVAKLREEFRGLGSPEIVALKQKGVEITSTQLEHLLAFTGDTKIEFLNDPVVRQAQALIMEVTYIDEEKPVEHARAWGHIHLQELLPRLDELSCRQLVLIHFSRRYSFEEVQRKVMEKVPEPWRERITICPHIHL